MQQKPKWLKDIIRWFPTGIGGVATGHFVISQQWKEAVLSSMVTAGLSLWAKFSSGFMEGMEKGVNERGKKSAELILKQADTLPNKLRWKFSGFQDKYYRSLVDKFIKLKTEGFNIGLPLLKLEDVFVSTPSCKFYSPQCWWGNSFSNRKISSRNGNLAFSSQ